MKNVDMIILMAMHLILAGFVVWGMIRFGCFIRDAFNRRNVRRWDQEDFNELERLLKQAEGELLGQATETLGLASIYIREGKYYLHEMWRQVPDRKLVAKAIVTITKWRMAESGSNEIMVTLSVLLRKGMGSSDPKVASDATSLVALIAMVDRPFMVELYPMVFPWYEDHQVL